MYNSIVSKKFPDSKLKIFNFFWEKDFIWTEYGQIAKGKKGEKGEAGFGQPKKIQLIFRGIVEKSPFFALDVG